MGSSSLVGQVAVVTGASRGIGRVVAVHLAARGAAVAAVARPSPELQELAETGRHAGHRLVALPADVTVPAEVDQLTSRSHTNPDLRRLRLQTGHEVRQLLGERRGQ